MTDLRKLSVLTPYLMPPGTKRVVNVGDGFILRGIERLFGRFEARRSFTNRIAPRPSDVEIMRESKSVILAGANQLNDEFSPWPGLAADEIRRSGLVLLPVGVGLHGEPNRNERMSDETISIIEAMHERISFSSWRCPATTEYLKRSVPRLGEKFLMTGCPVIYDRPLLEETRFHSAADVVAVTATERSDFWERETRTIDFVARKFPGSRRLFVVHQDYSTKKRRGLVGMVASLMRKSPAMALRDYAKRRGFDIVVPKEADEALKLYAGVDMHFGSRLHAHLHMLSRNRRSFLTKVDERMTGMARHFDFPICDPARFDDVMDFDFERVRRRALATHEVMQKFVHSAG